MGITSYYSIAFYGIEGVWNYLLDDLVGCVDVGVYEAPFVRLKEASVDSTGFVVVFFGWGLVVEETGA